MSFTISKIIEVSAAHSLSLPYQSPCANLHGHNWLIEVVIISQDLNKSGMIIDFCEIDKVVKQLDHPSKPLEDIIEVNSTAENIALWISIQMTMVLQTKMVDFEKGSAIPYVSMVRVVESEGSEVCYTP